MSPRARNKVPRRIALSAALAAGVNLLLLGALLALNGAPPPAAPRTSTPPAGRAVRVDTPLRRSVPRPKPLPSTPPLDSPEPRERAAGDVPSLSEGPSAPGVRPLDFVPASGVSDAGLVPFGLPLGISGLGTAAGAIGESGGDGIGTVGIGELDSAPREVSTPLPPYPAAARRAGIEGKVEAKLLLSAEGTVERVEIVRWEGHSSFPETVRRGLESWTFTPAIRGGRPIRIWKPYVLRFQLND